MLSTSQLRQAWSPACQLQPALRYVLPGGVPVTVDGRIREALDALTHAMRHHGYEAREGQTWGYNCRRITGGTGYSLHAYGIAVDINSLANPYSSRLITDMPAGMIAQIEALHTKNGKRVWGWGGRYSRNKDAMHFEIVCTPADLATGIATVRAPQPKPEPEPEDDDMIVPINVAPGESKTFHVEPTERGFLGPATARSLLVLNSRRPARVWVYAQLDGGGHVDLPGGFDTRGWTRGLPRGGGWLHIYVEPESESEVGGQIMYGRP